MNLLSLLVSPFIRKMNKNIPKDCILIDVRTPTEYANGHIAGSINIPLGSELSAFKNVCPDTDANILVFCASGMRSSTFKSSLEKVGYKNVHNGGGIGSVALFMNKPIIR
jgi:phage shock protein E